jgi:hypothetical protein
MYLQLSFPFLQFTLSYRRITDLSLCQVPELFPQNLAGGIFRNGIDESNAAREALMRSHLLR